MARAGDVVAERFELEQLAGAGGMGQVFRARDRVTGERVAVKVMREAHEADEARFLREAEVLAEVRHPGLVRYVAHGRDDGAPYLAMEWLDGEDLSRAIARGPFSIEGAMALARAVAEALGAVHARGVVHRDLKPGNIFLVASDPHRPKLLDFGIARLDGLARMTGTGVVIGTLGYMAPEQARSLQSADARADVFALGCVLFECLTGSPAFAADNLPAVLAKVLFEEARRLREVRNDVPRALEDLVASMLAKDPSQRPRDGTAVAEALAAIGAHAVTGPLSMPPIDSLGGGERQLLSVLFVDRAHDVAGAEATTVVAEGTPPHAMLAVAERFGGRGEVLADGSLLVTLRGSGSATDRAAHACRCALALRESSNGRAVAVATGLGEQTARVPVGAAIDRAAALLGDARGAFSRLLVDDVTAGLLDARFQLSRAERGFELVSVRDAVTARRVLLGRETPFVGRERELSTLIGLFDDAVDGPLARAAIVTAGPGFGKSRLAAEVAKRASERGGVVWTARGDPMGAAALSVLSQIVRSACKEVRSPFLAELAGAPLADADAPPELLAARRDARLMSEQLERAFLRLVESETRAHPVLIVVDDVQWCDAATLRFLDASLRDVRDAPFLVLALGRPETEERFPRLFSDREVQSIRLGALARKAAERLAREILGDVDPAVLAQLVAKADGNAFYLEELIRAFAEGRGGALPETVLAMVEARLEGLDADARRVLRAASVFGETFWTGAVSALIGGPLERLQGGRSTDTRATASLRVLVEREVLARRSESRFVREEELAFRHALVREAAYAMLTDGDRTLGHRLAGEWLERAGEPDPVILAQHFERGGDPSRAGVHYLRAAELANRAGEAVLTRERALRGLEVAAQTEVRLELHAILAELHAWQNEWDAAARHAEETMRVGAPGSHTWARGAAVKLASGLQQRRTDVFVEVLTQLLATEPSEDALAMYGAALAIAVFILVTVGKFAKAREVLDRLHALVEPVSARDPIARGWMLIAHPRFDAWVDEDPFGALTRAEQARASFLEGGHGRGARLSQVFVGICAWLVGDLPRAEQALRDAELSSADFSIVASLGPFCLSSVLADRGAFAEARQVAETMIADAQAERFPPPHEPRGRWALSHVLLAIGDAGGAEREARLAIEGLGALPLDRAAVLGLLAGALLAQGRVDAATAAIDEAVATFASLGGYGLRGPFVRAVHADVLRAAGKDHEAREVLLRERERLDRIAARLPAELRDAFFALPDHARIRNGA